MAEESLKLSKGSQLVKVDGGGSRRQSSGKSRASTDRIEISPRYLRAPAANCHHICKYGGKVEATEGEVLSEKKKKPMPISRTSLPGVHELHKSKSRSSDVHQVSKSSNTHFSGVHELHKSKSRSSDVHQVSKSSNTLFSGVHELHRSKPCLSDSYESSKSSTPHLSDVHEEPKSSTTRSSDRHEAPKSRTHLSDDRELPKSEIPSSHKESVSTEKKKPSKLKSVPTSKTNSSGVHGQPNSKPRLSEGSKSRIPRLSAGRETSKSRTSMSDSRASQKSGSPLSSIHKESKLKGGKESRLKGCASDASKATKKEVSSSEKVQPSVRTKPSKAKSSNIGTKGATPKSSTTKPLHPTSQARTPLSEAKSSKMATKGANLKPQSPTVKPLHPTSLIRTALLKAKSSSMATESATRKPKSPKVNVPHRTPSVTTASPKAKSSNLATKSAMKPKSPAVKQLHSTEPAVGGLSSRKNSGSNLGKASGGYKVSGKKVMTSPKTSSRPVIGRGANSKLRKQGSLKIASPSKSRIKFRKSEVKQPADQDVVQDKTRHIITSETENKPSESCGFDQNENFAVGLSLSPKSPTLGEFPHNEFDKSESSLESENKITKSEVKQHDQDEVQDNTLCVITPETVNIPSQSCGFDQIEDFAVGLSASPPMTSPKSSSQREFPLNEFDQSKSSAELSQSPPCECGQSESSAQLSQPPPCECDQSESSAQLSQPPPCECDQSESSAELSQPSPCECDHSENLAAALSVSPPLKSSTEPDFPPSLTSYDDDEEDYDNDDVGVGVDDDDEEDYDNDDVGVGVDDDDDDVVVIDDDEDDDDDDDDDECDGDPDVDNHDESVVTETAMTTEQKNMVRRAAKVHAEDIIEPKKLSFRRGKVVEIQFEDDSGPRKLKFRRGRVLDENEIAKAIARRRRFKPRKAVGETNDDESVPEHVVLRHQEVQEKKDEKGLFNNVIEETASKLAGTKKSKVKALVGAFETVISLQDIKPSATTVS